MLANACGVTTPDVATLVGPSDQLTREIVGPQDLIHQLLAAQIDRVTVFSDGQFAIGIPPTRRILPGSFNPLHAGHLGLAQAAAELLGGPVSFEMSVLNVDKPPLDAAEVRRRMSQFAWRATVELTRAATFREKARLLPGSTFVVGADTAERIVDSSYYGGTESEMLGAIAEIAGHGCRFLVASRADGSGRFRTLADIAVPEQSATIFTEIPQSRFRLDISSSGLRDGD
ncbi:MAG: hypothetical protein HY000_18345 [Planctomycetes bacterium]|nr:hypothetical protein [Planctomycetota bacterium]